MQRDLMPGGSSLREQGQIFLVVAGSYHKKGAVHPGGIQGRENIRRGLAGAVIKGQADPFFRRRREFFRHRGRRGLTFSRCQEFRVRNRGQIALPAADDRRGRIETPQQKTGGQPQHQENYTTK